MRRTTPSREFAAGRKELTAAVGAMVCSGVLPTADRWRRLASDLPAVARKANLAARDERQESSGLRRVRCLLLVQERLATAAAARNEILSRRLDMRKDERHEVAGLLRRLAAGLPPAPRWPTNVAVIPSLCAVRL